VFLTEFEVRETLYRLRGSYGGVLYERGAQGAENLLFFASNEDVRLCFVLESVEARASRDSREILFDFEPRWAEFEGDPLGLKPGRNAESRMTERGLPCGWSVQRDPFRLVRGWFEGDPL
jgi:hypothetical protein